jgi:hypothetical protein
MTLDPNGEVKRFAAALLLDSWASVTVLPPAALVLMIVTENPLCALAARPVMFTLSVVVTKYTSATPGDQSFWLDVSDGDTTTGAT